MSSKEARILVVMPAHNEATHIRSCLDSFVAQTRPPDLLVVVDDHSTDDTAGLVRPYTQKYPWIQLRQRTSAPSRIPGAKVVEAFLEGLPQGWEHFDYLGKFDADLVLPRDYFEKILACFASNPKLGMCSGLLYVENKGQWVYESIADKSQVRGPVKCYSRDCYRAMGGLRPFIGWDVGDVMLARFHGFETTTLADLQVKHLRPTGSGYSRRNGRLQGRALYNLRYGWLLGGVAALKMALTRGTPLLPWHALRGYAGAFLNRKERMLSPEEGRFVRKWRWKGIFSRLFKGL